jgi:hypothetical protein
MISAFTDAVRADVYRPSLHTDDHCLAHQLVGVAPRYNQADLVPPNMVLRGPAAELWSALDDGRVW